MITNYVAWLLRTTTSHTITLRNIEVPLVVHTYIYPYVKAAALSGVGEESSVTRGSWGVGNHRAASLPNPTAPWLRLNSLRRYIYIYRTSTCAHILGWDELSKCTTFSQYPTDARISALHLPPSTFPRSSPNKKMHACTGKKFQNGHQYYWFKSFPHKLRARGCIVYFFFM